MKKMIGRILLLDLLLVFALYGYSQNTATTAPAKETKTAKTASCSGKSMENCKTACTAQDKAKCGGEAKSCCKGTASNCCKGKSEGSGCRDKAGATQSSTPDKTTTPKK